MPFVDLQSRLGINVDRWLLLQSGEQPNKQAARCHAFEKEWVECAHGIGQTRAKKECLVELEDFYECLHRQKTENQEETQKSPAASSLHPKAAERKPNEHQRLYAIRQQREKLIKEGKYTPPTHHAGETDQSP
ncbi:NADH dehydrogenase [ubiquinone] iron-sulfur protein 5 isoform X1 [Girardinichthys multiradiatus]|uniref:NADH dehydrogenase [ubiquinone] iron-sulfur protein 5 isoform X1 n=1 Tax=Girardinichthys multiradiatus TaxID=208333 RepID=UPI001FAE214A|nr:NADH dehydrogenase [ubiquinone] iron-sulfur protein 5 isoform X1 [Girardinichthys multiradiatus]XP_047240132.1 NADH dehydrogenase [ubiquinone] iron-sulfur protein 5 isoform X1 [Girardinichthys multiradiatus]XP_047240133.1 NADH dehydrogenase [ubiquinone] iron-sulfur protein 5 isoform X1 [Girardinichthys multiradiatus]